MNLDSNPAFRINPDSVCRIAPKCCGFIFFCRRQSFHQVSWKLAIDCMRDANKYPKISYPVMVREVKTCSGIRMRAFNFWRNCGTLAVLGGRAILDHLLLAESLSQTVDCNVSDFLNSNGIRPPQTDENHEMDLRTYRKWQHPDYTVEIDDLETPNFTMMLIFHGCVVRINPWWAH